MLVKKMIVSAILIKNMLFNSDFYSTLSLRWTRALNFVSDNLVIVQLE